MEDIDNVSKLRFCPIWVVGLAATTALEWSAAPGVAAELKVEPTDDLKPSVETKVTEPKVAATDDLTQTISTKAGHLVARRARQISTQPDFAQFEVEPSSPAPNGDTAEPTMSPSDDAETPPPSVPATEDDPVEPAPAIETQPQTAPSETDAQGQPRVLVSEVVIRVDEADAALAGTICDRAYDEVDTGTPDEQRLRTACESAYNAIATAPGRTATRTQLQEDINAIFATGYFSNVRAVPEDTPLGVRVTFVVDPNPILREVRVLGDRVLPDDKVNEFFGGQYNQTLNFQDLQNGIDNLNEWYQNEGYVLAQVVEAPDVSDDGIVTLEVAEGVVEDIRVRFLTEEGEPTTAEGEPVEGRTREFIITREMALKPGDVFNREVVQQDLRRIFDLGLFEDVRLSLEPGSDPRKAVVVVNAIEGNSGSLAAGGGFSSATGLFGTVSYQEQNLGGNNQNLGAEVQIGERGVFFDARFTDPWIAGDPYRTSYTINAFSRRSISLIFDEGEDEVELPNGDRPRVNRLGSRVNFTRPLSDNPLEPSEWTASLGLEYQRVSIRDDDGEISPEDELGNDLSFSGDGKDDLVTMQLAAVQDLRDNRRQPSRGSLLRISTEQSAPIGKGSIFLNRLRGSYSRYIPVEFTDFSDESPETLALNLQAGTVVGDLPPYEAFILGGSNSVRGYGEGELGAGRSYVVASAEYRFPIFSIVGGALFVDAGTDLGTGDNVPGEPAEIRGKPGSGFGYGVGVRIQSPLGAIRIDYAINDEGDNRFHFGIGERF